MESIWARRLAQLVGDPAGDRPPRYAALAGRVRLLVADGRVPLGARLPAERELAGALGLSRATVTAAYARLREDGWADARQGAGTFAVLPAGPARGAWLPTPPGRRRDRPRPRRPRRTARGARRLRRRPGRAAAAPARARLPPGRAAGAAGADRRAVHRTRPADDTRAGRGHHRCARRGVPGAVAAAGAGPAAARRAA